MEGRHKGEHLNTDLCSSNQTAIVPDTKTTNFLCQYSFQQDNYGVWKTINMYVSLCDEQRVYLLMQDILNVEIIGALRLLVWGSLRTCLQQKHTVSVCLVVRNWPQFSLLVYVLMSDLSLSELNVTVVCRFDRGYSEMLRQKIAVWMNGRWALLCVFTLSVWHSSAATCSYWCSSCSTVIFFLTDQNEAAQHDCYFVQRNCISKKKIVGKWGETLVLVQRFGDFKDWDFSVTSGFLTFLSLFFPQKSAGQRHIFKVRST